MESAASSSEKATRARKTYALLGLRAGCSEAAIRKAYRDLSRELHPDKQVGKSATEAAQAAALFLKVKDAYEVLSDEVKRREYEAAVLMADRAQKALNERVAKLDENTRRMRTDLERREAQARQGQQSGNSTSSLRRKNAATTAAFSEERRRAQNRASKRSSEDHSEREARKRRSLRLVATPLPNDQALHRIFARIGPIESIERSDRGATILFQSEDDATNAAIDLEITHTFKQVKLCSTDAWNRLHEALKKEQSAENGSSRKVKSRKRKVDLSDQDLYRFGTEFAQHLHDQHALLSKRPLFASVLQDNLKHSLKNQQPSRDNTHFTPQREFDLLSRLLSSSTS